MASELTKAENKEATLPLHSSWSLWYDNPRLAPPNTTWRENLKHVATFTTAEEFWSTFNNILPSSQLAVNGNYHLFRTGIEPMWEDKSNVEGGKFVMTMAKADSKKGKGDEWWLYTALALIGETMDESGSGISGAVVSIRKREDRIALWLRNCDKDACVNIGARWKAALEVSNKTILRYQSHASAAASGSSFKNEVMFEV